MPTLTFEEALSLVVMDSQGQTRFRQFGSRGDEVIRYARKIVWEKAISAMVRNRILPYGPQPGKDDGIKDIEAELWEVKAQCTELQAKLAKAEGDLRTSKMQHLDSDKRNADLIKALRAIHEISYEALEEELG